VKGLWDKPTNINKLNTKEYLYIEQKILLSLFVLTENKAIHATGISHIMKK
jgi:hypothetical protein